MGRKKKVAIQDVQVEPENQIDETLPPDDVIIEPEQDMADDTLNSAKDDLLEVQNVLDTFAEEAPDEDDQPKKRGRKSKDKGEFVIPGSLLVMITDRLCAAGVATVDGFINKQPIDQALLQLDESQIKQLVPLAEEALKAMKLADNPITAFFGSMVAFHIANYLALRMIMKSKPVYGA